MYKHFSGEWGFENGEWGMGNDVYHQSLLSLMKPTNNS